MPTRSGSVKHNCPICAGICCDFWIKLASGISGETDRAISVMRKALEHYADPLLEGPEAAEIAIRALKETGTKTEP